jgi:hypothetical protein
MQRAYVEVGAPQRNAISEKAPAQFVKQFDVAVNARTLTEDPALGLIARYWCTPTAISPLDAEEVLSASPGRGDDVADRQMCPLSAFVSADQHCIDPRRPD